MFFATKYWVAKGFFDKVQVWKTKIDIKIIFLVEYLNHMSWTISALPRLYNSVFPLDSNPDFNDLDIKHWDINRRNKLVRMLFDNYKISGWFTSLENKVELEVCLFDKQANSNQLLLIDICEKNKKYIKDSLQRIKVFTSISFYKQTSVELNRIAPILTDDKDHYKRYKKYVNSSINYYVEEGLTKVKAKHLIFNLRTKLKI
jgi:hypothetical protein